MADFVFLGCPSYNNLIHAGAAQSIYQTASRNFNVMAMVQGRGLTSPNCNDIWCTALNARLDNPAVKWFAMLHADVAPEPWWIDIAIAEAERTKADMLSAVIPLKDARAVTSTVIASEDWTPDNIAAGKSLPKRFGRLTMRQVMHSRFPKTFGINECCDALAQLPEEMQVTNAPRHMLLLNTGCMVVRLTANIDWEKVFFSVIDGIMLQNGRYVQWDASEDWLFSARMAFAGARCMATKAVRAMHWGNSPFPNDRPWGSAAKESDYIEAELVR